MAVNWCITQLTVALPQKYSKAEVYPYEMNDGDVLNIKQVSVFHDGLMQWR